MCSLGIINYYLGWDDVYNAGGRMKKKEKHEEICTKGQGCGCKIRQMMLVCIPIIIMIVLAILFERVLHNRVDPDQETLWLSSVASYWGGIVGGVISGLIAFLGVFFTIRYYKSSDFKKEVSSVQPFLLIRIDNNDPMKNRSVLEIGKKGGDPILPNSSNVVIQNIGNGFASVLIIYTSDDAEGIRLDYVIPIGAELYFNLIYDRNNLLDGGELSFSIRYLDSMTNEYIQNYRLKLVNEYPQIMSEYPQLLKHKM